MIAVVDYHKGNLKSVERGLALAGGDPCISDDAAVIAQASAIVLPGVGAFSDAITTMGELGLTKLLRDRILAGVPFLGICLGMHLMFEQGEEGSPDDSVTVCYQGLGILPGTVTRIPKTDSLGNVYKVPHVGWNTVSTTGSALELPLGVRDGEYYYFTHSFMAPIGAYTLATTTHSVTFPSVVQYGDAAFGVQFHPEKSSDAGLAVLRSFVALAKEYESTCI